MGHTLATALDGNKPTHDTMKRNEPKTRTRNAATDDGPAVQTYVNVSLDVIAGETQRHWIQMN